MSLSFISSWCLEETHRNRTCTSCNSKSDSFHSREYKVPTLTDCNLSQLHRCTYHSKHQKPQEWDWCTATHKKILILPNISSEESIATRKQFMRKEILMTRTASESSWSEQDEIPIYSEANHSTRPRTSLKSEISLRSILTEWRARDIMRCVIRSRT